MSDIDMHLHTNLSDGKLSIKALAKELSLKNMQCVSLTDHETTNGTLAMKNECAKYGIKTIPGIEMEATYDFERNYTLHLLCYDYKNIKRLNKFLEELDDARRDAIKDAINKLKSKNIFVTIEEVKDNCKMKKATLNSLISILVKRGIFSSYQQGIKEFLDRSSPLYVDYPRYSARYMLDLINSVGGVSVLAHPKTIEYTDKRLDELMKYLKDNGLDGIETYCRKCSEKVIRRSEQYAKEYNLLETVGSDFHEKKSGSYLQVHNVPKEKILILKDRFYM